MLENILVALALLVSAWYIGRRFFRQWRMAVNRDTGGCCAENCCSCCQALPCAEKAHPGEK